MAGFEPRSKRKDKSEPDKPLPIMTVGSGETYKFKGKFNGLSVVIEDNEDMKKIISMGYFGKANLSRNFPNFQALKPEIIRRRVSRTRRRHNDPRKSPQKIIVLPDSDSDENYLENFKPEYELDQSGIKETVNLGLEEAFFLCSAIQCLDVHYDSKILNLESLWQLFTQTDKYFVQNYVVYYYFRSKNWVVKPGIKFGGDFLLYKQGPPFFHASFVVIIHNVDENLKSLETLNRRSMNYMCMMGLHRLCETAGKEFLICDVIWPRTLLHCDVSFEDLSKFSIKETIMKRWISSQQRQLDFEDL